MKQEQSTAIEKAVIETLEDRKLYSTVSVADGVMTVTGDANSANAVRVKLVDGKVQTIVNGRTTSNAATGIQSIKIVGGEKTDYIEVATSLAIPVNVQTKGGNDRVVSGGGNDTIDGGTGDDVLHGGGGNDAINAGDGSDRVYAGRGNDSINGGAGADLSYGDDGDDKFALVERNDKVFGGYGRDTMTVATSNVPPAAPNTPTTGQAPTNTTKLTGFSLIDAATGKPVNGYTNISTGDTLDLRTLPAKLNIAANVSGSAASVRFDFDGAKAYKVESSAPFALGGNAGAAFNAITLPLGSHALTGHAVSSNGTILSTAGVTFKVIRSTATAPAPSTGSSSPVETPTTETTAGTPEAKITAVSAIVPAGTAVHVDALASQMKNGGWNEGQYLWDFGDAGGKYNTLKGFNAAHVYEKPGTYSVTLTVVNKAGNQGITRMTINVTEAARQVIYVSSSGSDGNNGLSQGSPIKSFSKAASLLKDNTEILFRRGDTFNTDAGIWVKGNNVVIGAYGMGEQPTIKWTGDRNGRAIFNTQTEASNVTIQDLSLDTRFNEDTNDAGTPLGFSVGGKNITIRRNELLNLQYGANLNVQPDGALIQDNVAPLETGIRKYFVWVEGSRVSIIGNTCVNSTREHIVRVNLVSKVLVSGNTFTNISRRDDGDYWDYRKTSLNVQSGEFAYLAGNTLDGPFQIGPLGQEDGLKYPERRFKYAIAEGNVTKNTNLEVKHGAQHVTVRHNKFDANGFMAIDVNGYNTIYKRGIIDLVVHNNTAYNSEDSGNFIRVRGSVDGIRLLNNLYVAPSLTIGAKETAAVKIDESDLGSFTKIDGNIWPVGNVASWIGEEAMNYIGASYVREGFQSDDEWNNQSVVGTDLFTNVTLTTAKSSMVISGKVIGAAA